MLQKLKAALFPIILFSLASKGLCGAEPKYKVSDIPKDLLKDAKAVVRKNEVEFKISDIDKAVENVTYAITILNENGIDKSVFYQFYDKFSSVRKISVNLYDQNGEVIRNGANVNVKDYSAIAGYSLYEDSRVKFVDPKYRTTPFTVEVSYEIAYDGLFGYPKWHVYEDYNVGVEKSKLTVITAPGFSLRYKEFNMKDSCRIVKSDNKTEYNWEANDFPAIREEPFSLPISKLSPSVYLAPSDFEIGGSQGNCESWDNLGKWIYKLQKDRNILEPETREKILSIVSGAKNDIDKIRILYNYLQTKVRYVNITIGLGGWQTINAETVDRLSYGDCKALSNYMKSLLDIVGIKSLFTIVMAGDDAPAIFDDFPSAQFNHAILCVPLTNDTIWLECTNQRIPFGYLGAFTDDRKVLVTGENGGSLVRTKQYSQDENVQIRNGSVKLNPDGNGESGLKTSFKGILYENIFPILAMDENDRKLFIQKQISLPIFNLLSYSFSEDRSIVPCITENLKISLPNYGAIVGKRMYFNPNILSRFAKVPYRTQERKSEIYLRRSYQELDTIEYIIPLNYLVDKLPDKKNFKSKFGEYSSEVTSNGDKIKYVRLLKFTKGQYPVSDYNSFVDFCEQISVADQGKVILNSSK
jgi:transglutaminase-like putative cysteine protease